MTESDEKPEYFLAVDGGGSTCRVRLYDAAGNTLGEGQTGPANTRLGLEKVFAEIEQACLQALQVAGLSPDIIPRTYAGLGLAGLMLQSERDKVLAFPHPFAGISVENDAYIACLGAHAGGDGGLMIVGTGSCGCAIVAGKEFTVGGWGFQLADQGSGAWIGHAAIRQALLAYEHVIAASALAEAIMAKFSNSPEQAVLWADQAQPKDFAEFVPLVFEYAWKDDAIARQILHDAAADLDILIKAILNKGVGSVVLFGGLAEPIMPWLAAQTQSVLVAAQGDALDGALLIAQRDIAATRK